MENTQQIQTYLKRIEGVYKAILKDQARCGEELAKLFDEKISATPAFTAPVRMNADSLAYFAEELSDEGAPSGNEEVTQEILAFRTYLLQEVVPTLHDIADDADEDETTHEGEVLAEFLEVLGDQQMSAHVATLERLFEKYL